MVGCHLVVKLHLTHDDDMEMSVDLRANNYQQVLLTKHSVTPWVPTSKMHLLSMTG